MFDSSDSLKKIISFRKPEYKQVITQESIETEILNEQSERQTKKEKKKKKRRKKTIDDDISARYDDMSSYSSSLSIRSIETSEKDVQIRLPPPPGLFPDRIVKEAVAGYSYPTASYKPEDSKRGRKFNTSSSPEGKEQKYDPVLL